MLQREVFVLQADQALQHFQVSLCRLKAGKHKVNKLVPAQSSAMDILEEHRVVQGLQELAERGERRRAAGACTHTLTLQQKVVIPAAGGLCLSGACNWVVPVASEELGGRVSDACTAAIQVG